MLRLMSSVATCCALAAFGATSTRHYATPTGVDSLLDANPIPLPAVKPADMQNTESPVPQPTGRDTTVTETSTTVFRVQLDALSDMDAAQARKAVLEQTLGEKVDVLFDPPYYKLRLGNFATKREAEDALADLAEKNIQGFVVKQ